MKFYPISITGTILLLSSVVVPIKHIWAEDSKCRTRQTKAHKLPTPSRAYRTINLHKFKSQFMARLLTNAYRHFWIKDMHKKRAYTKRQTHTHWHQGETGVRQDWLSLPVAPESILIFPTLLFLHTALSCSRLHFYFSFPPFSSLFLFFFLQNCFFPQISLASFKRFTLWSDLTCCSSYKILSLTLSMHYMTTQTVKIKCSGYRQQHAEVFIWTLTWKNGKITQLFKNVVQNLV